MCILIFLIIGFIIGWLLRKKRYKLNLTLSVNLLLFLLIFLMGVEVGKIKVNAFWILGTSILFAITTITGSLFISFLIKKD